MAGVKSSVLGVGINDADYKTTGCPYYVKWKSMLERCYSGRVKRFQPYYIDCEVCQEWLKFSNFKAWMETQNWQGKHLDKDLMSEGNKVYSPTTCCFISPRLNSFLINIRDVHNNQRGTSWITSKRKWKATLNYEGKSWHLGYYDSQEEAHFVWRSHKGMALDRELIILLQQETDPVIVKALLKFKKQLTEE